MTRTLKATILASAAPFGSMSRMDHLPDELFLRVLSFVPPSDFGPGCFRLRSVCRRWRSLLASSAYSALRSELGLASDWLLTLTERLEGGLLCKLFDPLTNRCQVKGCRGVSMLRRAVHQGRSCACITMTSA